MLMSLKSFKEYNKHNLRSNYYKATVLTTLALMKNVYVAFINQNYLVNSSPIITCEITSTKVIIVLNVHIYKHNISVQILVLHIPVPPVFHGKFSKIPRKYFMNSMADLSKFRGNSAEIMLSFYITYK